MAMALSRSEHVRRAGTLVDMRIYVYPGDRWGCGHYRLIWPAQAVAADLDVTVVAADDFDRQLAGTVDGNKFHLRYPPDADIIVLQRPAHPMMPTVIRTLRRQGITVVVDIDDDLAAIHPGNAAHATYNPATPGSSWRHVMSSCRHANLVTTSTPALAERYGAARVLPNYIPASWLDIPHDDTPTISWCGSLHSHAGDLTVVGAAVAKTVRNGARYRTTGNGEGVEAELHLPAGTDTPTGDIPFAEWPHHVARAGIAIAPLADTRFNRSKSWLKPLEAMACGVPVVMSPRVEYRRLHEQTGVGFLAARPREWAGHLNRLTRDSQLRAEQSDAGRRAVHDHYTLEQNAWRWAEAWTDAHRISATAV